MFGSILMSSGNSSTFVEFFGEKEVKGKKIHELVPELQPTQSPTSQRPSYQYLMHELEQVRKKVMNVKVAKEEASEVSLQLSMMSVGFGTTLFTGIFKQLNPKMEVILLVDINDKIIGCNSQTLPILGYTEEQLLHRPVSVLLAEQPSGLQHPRAGDSGEALPKRRKSIDILGQNQNSVWRGDEYEKQILEVRHKNDSVLLVVLTCLPVNSHKLLVMMRKVEGTEETSQELRTVGRYTIGAFIAAGNYGKVKRANRIDTGAEVAVKIINKKLMSQEEEKRAMQEIEILKKLDHPNIIHFHEVVDSRDRLYLFMEYVQGGQTLKQHMEKGLSEFEAKDIFTQIATAIYYCHNNCVVHRDIKPTNILIDHAGRAKIIDFGLSAVCEAGKLQGTFCGSPAYAPPEIILGTKYSGEAADVWCLGVLLYAMVTNKLPFDCFGKILACNWTRPDNVSDECRDLLNRMIVYDFNQRITMSEILTHPWLNR